MEHLIMTAAMNKTGTRHAATGHRY